MIGLRDARVRLGILLVGAVLVTAAVIVDLRSGGAGGYALRPLVMAAVVAGVVLTIAGIVLAVMGTPAKESADQAGGEAKKANIGKIYTGAAILALNTLLMLGVLNLILGGIFAWTERRRAAEQSEVYDLYSDFLAPVYPGYSPDEIEQMLDEAFSRPPTCNAFTHFIERPIDGEFVNVTPEGFREIAQQAAWPPDTERNTIFVFGGSTTFGYGVADGETTPSYLQEFLRAEGVEADVYNFGQGAFFSTQELILFENLLREGRVPDTAIFIDGLNEFYSWEGIPESLATCGYEAATRENQPFVLPMLRLAANIREGLSEAREAAAVADRSPSPDDAATNRAVIERWLANKAMIEAVAEAYGVKVLFIWQPVPTYHYDLEYHPYAQRNPASFERHERSRYGYEVMAGVLADGGPETANIVDLSEMQADREERLYVDIVHYSAAFSREIAERIGETLVGR